MDPMTAATTSGMGDPGATGRFGEFGGRFIPESLVPACNELDVAFRQAWSDPAFRTEYDTILRDYGGRAPPGPQCRHPPPRLRGRLPPQRGDPTHPRSPKNN